MLCLSKKAIRADEDPHEGPKKNPSRGRRSIIKKVSDKIKKWVKKPKQAPPNPSPEPRLGRRNEMVLDLNDPLPFYRAMHCMDPNSPNKKPPSDPKKKIIFTTSSSQFMRIEEVVPQHQGIRIGSQGHGRPVGMNIVRQGHMAWRPNLIEYKKVEESRGDETDLSLYLEKGKGIVQYPEESDSDSDSDSDRFRIFPCCRMANWDSDKERRGLALSSEIKTEESRSGAIQVEEIPVEEVSLEPNEIVELPPKKNPSRGRSVLSLASPPPFGALSFCSVSNTRGRTQRRKQKQMRTLLHFPSSASCGLRAF